MGKTDTTAAAQLNYGGVCTSTKYTFWAYTNADATCQLTTGTDLGGEKDMGKCETTAWTWKAAAASGNTLLGIPIAASGSWKMTSSAFATAATYVQAGAVAAAATILTQW